MIGGVVVNQEDFLPSVATCQVVEKVGITWSIEHAAMPVIELRPIQIDGAENLLRVALARSGNERLMASTCPSLIEAGILAETGFVGEE